MTKQEFEKIAGYEVSVDDYEKIIEPMYMACPLDKLEFVKCLNKSRFAMKDKRKYISEIKSIGNAIIKKCGHTTTHEEEDKLGKLTKEFCDRFGYSYSYPEYGYELPGNRGCQFIKRIYFVPSDYGNEFVVEITNSDTLYKYNAFEVN